MPDDGNLAKQNKASKQKPVVRIIDGGETATIILLDARSYQTATEFLSLYP